MAEVVKFPRIFQQVIELKFRRIHRTEERFFKNPIRNSIRQGHEEGNFRKPGDRSASIREHIIDQFVALVPNGIARQ